MTSYIKLHWPDEPMVIVHGGRRYRLWLNSSGRYQVCELLFGGKRTVCAYRRRKARRLRDRWCLLGQWRVRSQRPQTIERALGRARRTCETDAAKERQQERG